MSNNNQSVREQRENLLANLKWLRRHLGLTEREMGLRMGVGAATVRAVERGEISPGLRLSALFLLRDATGIQPHELFRCRLNEANCPHCKNCPRAVSEPL